MGYYQIKAKQNTKAGRKDPRYVEIFDRLRDLEYTVGEARWVAEETIKIMDANLDWTIEEAIRKVLE